MVHYLTASLETSMAFETTKTAFQSYAISNQRRAQATTRTAIILALPERRAETGGDTLVSTGRRQRLVTDTIVHRIRCSGLLQGDIGNFANL